MPSLCYVEDKGVKPYNEDGAVVMCLSYMMTLEVLVAGENVSRFTV